MAVMESPLPRRLLRSRLGPIVILLVLSIGLWESPQAFSQVQGLFHSLAPISLPSNRCGPAQKPAALSSSGPVAQTWEQLQQLFGSHPPQFSPREPSLHDDSANATMASVELPLPSTIAAANALRVVHQNLVARIPSEPPQGLYEGHGVVMMAGGERDQFAAVSLGMLRFKGSRLPVELWHTDEASAKPGWCRKMAREGISCRYLSKYVASVTKVFPHEAQQQAAAVFFSSFEHVLFLDADTIPILNPDGIFDSQPYRDTGMIHWPDFWQSSQSIWTDYVIGSTAEVSQQRADYGTIDPTLMMWDKRRHWRSLILVLYYNSYSSFYHPLFDSEPARAFGATFYTALRALSASHHAMPWLTPISYSAADGTSDGSGVCVFQNSPSDPSAYMFLHTSIHRFGLRDLMCDRTCIELHRIRPSEHQRLIGSSIRTMGAIATPSDRLHARLNPGPDTRRILAWKDLHARALDPERDIWTVLERLACEEGSVWNEGAICTNLQRYMSGTFGRVDPWRGECRA